MEKSMFRKFIMGMFAVLSLSAIVMCMDIRKAAADETQKNGLYHEEDGWNYYRNGEIASDTTTLVKYNGSWWYVENGKINFTAATLCKYNGSWWYVHGGKVDFGAATLVKYNGNWFYVHGGKVDFSARTLVKYNGTWWFVSGGKIDWNSSTVVKYGSTWYFVSGGKVNWNAYGLCEYGGQYWYIENGRINFSATTLCNYQGVWCYVRGGKVDFDARTLFKYNGVWWFIEEGGINWVDRTLVKYGSNWFYVNRGQVNWSYNGECLYNGSFFTVRDGIVRFGAAPTITDSEKEAQAYKMAKFIADNVDGDTDLERIRNAAKIVAYYSGNSYYTNDDPDYRSAYGVLCKGVYTCSGSTRALGLVLDCMGYKWEHVNPNAWTHQWCKVYDVDGKTAWADGMGGIADYGEEAPFASGGTYTDENGVTYFVP